MSIPKDRGGAAATLDRFRRIVNLTIAATFVLIVIGGIVRVSESGLGCGPAGSGTHGWPLCEGRLIPFIEMTSVIEYSHRVVAAIVGLLMLWIAYRAWRSLREHRWLVRGSIAGGVLVVAQAVLGGLTVENNLHEALVATHLGLAMILLGILIGLSWASRPARLGSAPPPRSPAVRRLGIGASALVLATIVAGGYMAGTQNYGTEHRELGDGAHMACGKEFPSCNGSFMPFGQAELVDIHLTHRALMYLTTIAILALILLARRRRIAGTALWVTGGILAAQILVGALNVWLGEHEWLIVAHLTLGTLLWGSVVAATLGFVRVPGPAEPGPEPGESAPGPEPAASESAVGDERDPAPRAPTPPPEVLEPAGAGEEAP